MDGTRVYFASKNVMCVFAYFSQADVLCLFRSSVEWMRAMQHA